MTETRGGVPGRAAVRLVRPEPGAGSGSGVGSRVGPGSGPRSGPGSGTGSGEGSAAVGPDTGSAVEPDAHSGGTPDVGPDVGSVAGTGAGTGAGSEADRAPAAGTGSLTGPDRAATGPGRDVGPGVERGATTGPGPRVPFVAGFARPVDAKASPKREGKALRAAVPRSVHAAAPPGPGRPDAVRAVGESSAGRLPELVPIRVGRMAASPFAFLRGSAALMASDLVGTPVSGIGAQLCGDAHAANFGLYGDARGGLVMDINDFDETAYGPWEWDLKRLVASLVLAGREAGADEDTCRAAAFDAAGAYRRTMRLLAKLPVLDAWNAIADEELVSHTDARDLLGTLERVAAKAKRNTSARFAARATEPVPDVPGDRLGRGARADVGTAGAGRRAVRRRFTDAPPVLRRVPDAEAAAVVLGLGEYLGTLPEDRLPLLARYEVQDVAFRVVGTGSVGLRSYVVLLLDHRGEALVLQVKEARPSALLPYASKAPLDPRLNSPLPGAAHEGRRIVLGQKRMQVVSDILLGWTTVDGRPFQVRQFRNRKGSVDPAALEPGQLDDYGRMTGALLARAHAHSADPRLIAGYCGKSDELDEALAAFAVAYADRTEADHAELAAAVRDGRVAAETGV